MDILELIKARRSVRRYKGVLVEKDKLLSVLEAGHWAPTAGNLQSWKYIVVKDKKKRHDIAEACYNQMWMTEAPILIVVGAHIDKIKRYYGVRGERLYAVQECAAAIQNMLLTAESVGLATCWVGAFDEAAVKRIADIPENVRPQAIISLGYGDEKVPTPSKYQLKDVVFFESYGSTRAEFFPLEKQIQVIKDKAVHVADRIKEKLAELIKKKR
jgi:nitroreductase